MHCNIMRSPIEICRHDGVDVGEHTVLGSRNEHGGGGDFCL